MPEGGNVEDIAVVKAANPLKAITVAGLNAKMAAPTMNDGALAPLHLQPADAHRSGRHQRGRVAVGLVSDTIPEGEPIWLGVDFGWMYDTTAIVPLWKRDDDYVLLGPATDAHAAA